ncbi:methylenetetrahydrofolate dehydrogenase (NADP+) / methenyltetrahydrofolate cyclohydrolase [Clostridium cavendishii DSM 21758]|uniref:Bifunctional protein FolD n=1 Tax=Clostridium cavendishii DSM 21758 TaxID=1121302 RepID=A0A1M6KK64_9CLOT|nr:tetrahydrofolate dehydrogenase/cyclohydrolase catalytic domain-containing protein [Clostridium cavendishii]SHJ59319.1 methylenetetrahydrofolate dehydrogenase (NADP+) / methenyltetrahydrofolate cyclohydrolase [Clostridium cavendishii DSM 21758]
MGIKIDGKELANRIKLRLKNEVDIIKNNSGKCPKVASILVGNDGGSIFYQNSQQKVATSLGIGFDKVNLDETIEQKDLENIIINLNNDNNIHGIMLLLPLPKQIDSKKVTSLINPDKDIDCLTDISVGRFYKGEESFIPCTPKSVLTILKELNVTLEGKNAVVIGRSDIVGKPVANLLTKGNATVTLCHSRTQNLKTITSKADILVVAIGKPNFITADFVKEGSVVIDVGTSSLNGKITGDVDTESVLEKVSLVTPVPGGVGALTTTLLLSNVVEASKKYVY